jgi:hypothetical protein
MGKKSKFGNTMKARTRELPRQETEAWIGASALKRMTEGACQSQ